MYRILIDKKYSENPFYEEKKKFIKKSLNNNIEEKIELRKQMI